mgnify:CR=1 FL=1
MRFDSLQPFFWRHASEAGQMDTPFLASDCCAAVPTHARVVGDFVLGLAALFAVHIGYASHKCLTSHFSEPGFRVSVASDPSGEPGR